MHVNLMFMWLRLFMLQMKTIAICLCKLLDPSNHCLEDLVKQTKCIWQFIKSLKTEQASLKLLEIRAKLEKNSVGSREGSGVPLNQFSSPPIFLENKKNIYFLKMK